MKRKPINPKCWWVLCQGIDEAWYPEFGERRKTHREASTRAERGRSVTLQPDRWAVAPYGRRTP